MQESRSPGGRRVVACSFTSDRDDFCAAADQVRSELSARMVQGQGALHFLRYRASGREAGKAHGGRARGLLRAVSLCFAGALRDLAAAPAAQSSVRAATAGIEPQAIGGAARKGIAAAGARGAGNYPGW